MRCFSALVDFLHIKKLFSPPKYLLFLRETQLKKIISKHDCLLCKKRLGIYFVSQNIQVESCYDCQKLWFDPSEIQKFQHEYEVKIVQQSLYTAQIPPTDTPHSAGLMNSGWAHVDPTLATKIYLFEKTTNFVGNKITDTNFFKKYPLLTFCLIMAAIVGYFYFTRHTN